MVKEDWRTPHSIKPIIIALQLPGDASLRGIDISKWALETCEEIREYTNRQIIVRTPQLTREFNTGYIEQMLNLHKLDFQVGTKENLIPTLKNAHCSVTYSSGLGVDSVLAGCPAIATNSASFVYDLCSNDLAEIESPKTPGRDQWIYNLCYSQWNSQEIKEGTLWQHLKELILKGI